MKRWAPPLAVVVLVVSSSLVGGYRGRRVGSTTIEVGAQDEVDAAFQEALQTVEDNYAGPPNLEIAGKDSIQGMLKTLDPHSVFYTKADFDDLQTEQRSRFYGVGVSIRKIYNHVYVLSTNPESPAARAGLRYGDAITAVDGVNADDTKPEEVMQRVRGERGEPVTLTIERPGVQHPFTVRLTRDEVKLPSVRLSFLMPHSSTGYIGLTGGFSTKTDDELSAALEDLKRQGMQQLVLDLRENRGGLLDQAIRVAERFLTPGERILEVRGRDDQIKPRVYSVPDDNSPEMMPLVILINQHTASASEVVAGALQDHSRAEIVGENSFGKGLVQTIFYLWGGTGLTLTTQRYYTPTGRSIQRDYSKVSFYDYYLNRHRSEEGGPETRAIFHTDLGREVYSGGGITPDKLIKSREDNALSAALYRDVFHFVRQLVAGQIGGFADYRVATPEYRSRVTEAEIIRYPVNDRLIDAFRKFIAERPEFGIPRDRLDANLDYLSTLLRREIIAAAYGAEAGEEVYLSDDPQLKAALESLPEAKQLAENAQHASPR